MAPTLSRKTPDRPVITNTLNNVYAMRTKSDLIKYLHLACWSLSVTTWCKATDRGYFATFPGLTSQQVRKYLLKSISTTKGHGTHVRKNLRSTSQPAPVINEEHIMTATDYPTGTNARTNLVTFKTITEYKPTRVVATDQTGCYPIRSSKGNQYIIVAYIRDAKVILAVLIINRSEATLVEAYSTIYDQLKTAGLQPKFQMCDNECPKAFRCFLKERDIQLQLVPPYDHKKKKPLKKLLTRGKLSSPSMGPYDRICHYHS